MLASIANAVMITDARGTIQWVNRAFTDLSGYRSDEAAGKSPRLLHSGTHDQNFYQDLWSTILAGRTWHGEMTERHKDGHLYTVCQTITPLADRQGRISHFVAVHEDVTQLRSSQHRLQALFDHALDAILLFDDQARYVDANPAVEALIGYGRDELVTMTVPDVLPAGERHRFDDAWLRLSRDGHARGSLAMRHKNGQMVDVEYLTVANIVPGVHVAIARDVTAQRAADATRRFQGHLLEAVGDAVMATDLDGIVRYWNTAAERLYGWEAQEVVDAPSST